MEDKNTQQFGPPDPEGLKKARQARIEADKAFREQFKKYEPYDFEEIDKITKEVINRTANYKIDEKIRDYKIVLKKICLIIKNSELVYDKLPKDAIDDPENYYDGLDQAHNAKENFRIKFDELKAEAARQTPAAIKSIGKTTPVPLPETDNSQDRVLSEVSPTSKQGSDKLTFAQIAKYTNMSESFFKHWKKNNIPVKKIGGAIRFDKAEVDEWIKADKPATRGKTPEEEIPETKFDESEKEKKYPEVDAGKNEKKQGYTFHVTPEFFTNVLTTKGYLTQKNADKMADRFLVSSSGTDDSIINWEKDFKSLVTFILVLEQLKLIETDNYSPRQPPKYYPGWAENSIEWAPLIKKFKVTAGGHSESAITRKREGIMNALDSIYKQVKPNSKDKSLKEILKYYYTHEGDIIPSDKYKNQMDGELLKIICQELVLPS